MQMTLDEELAQTQAAARARRIMKSSPGIGRALRVASGVSQAEIAALVGVTKQCVSNWEAGLTLPCTTLAPRYLRVLTFLADPGGNKGLESKLDALGEVPTWDEPRRAQRGGR